MLKKQYLPFILLIILITLFITGCGEQGSTGRAGATGSDGSAVMMFQDSVYPSNTYAGTKDNYLSKFGAEAFENFGGATNIGIGNRAVSPGLFRCIIKFDVTPIVPTNVTVTAAYLTLTVESIDNTNGNPTIEVHALLQSWAEGALNAAVGISNWISRESGPLNWATAGGSYESTVLDTKTISQIGNVTLTIPASVVQGWIDSPSSNYGLILMEKDDLSYSGTSYAIFSSRTNGTSAQNPRLTVYYKLP